MHMNNHIHDPSVLTYIHVCLFHLDTYLLVSCMNEPFMSCVNADWYIRKIPLKWSILQFFFYKKILDTFTPNLYNPTKLQVPGILFTPICPHSLSFRPLILPEHVTLRVQVPFNSRSHAWASFDGKDRKRLAPGDALVCSMAPWPVPTACQSDSTSDFLRSIHDGLHWNLRKTQSFDGPSDL